MKSQMSLQISSQMSSQMREFLATGRPMVEFRNVSIRFDGPAVLDGISFSVMHGETRILLGPAGCGKSVLMKLANGLLEPDGGEIFIFGRSLGEMTQAELFEMRTHVGMVFQQNALFDSLSVEDNVAYRLDEGHADPATAHARVVEILQFVALEKSIDKFPAELSGGMKRRVAIARAIISQPDLILYDSPTGGLDPITSNTIIELVVKQRDVSHTTCLLITHRMQDAFTLATHRYDAQRHGMERIPDGGIDPGTKFLVLNEGKIVFDGTTQELTHTEDAWLRRFIT